MYKNQNSGNKKPTTGDNAVKGVKNFLKGQKLEEDDFLTVLKSYFMELGLEYFSIEVMCDTIQKDFSKFVKWFKKTYK